MATTMRRPPSDLAGSSRAAQRKQRLLELENEQRLEDLEALKMTEEQRLSLFHSFRSVKFEWSDLDGMRSVRRRYNSPASQTQCHQAVPAPTPATTTTTPARPPHLELAPLPPAFAVLTNARLATLNADDTICLRTHHSAPASPSPYSASPQTPFPQTPTPGPYACSNRNPYGASPPAPRRSSVKGLFLASPTSPPSTAVATSSTSNINLPRARLSSTDSAEIRCEEDDEEGWEDEDEDATVSGDNDERGEEGEDESALPTAVAPRSWRFADALALDVGRHLDAAAAASSAATHIASAPSSEVGGKRKR